jgi:hypothetical protein
MGVVSVVWGVVRTFDRSGIEFTRLASLGRARERADNVAEEDAAIREEDAETGRHCSIRTTQLSASSDNSAVEEDAAAERTLDAATGSVVRYFENARHHVVLRSHSYLFKNNLYVTDDARNIPANCI